MVNITIVATGTDDDIAEYVRAVADEIIAGRTSGRLDADREWESGHWNDD